MNPTTAGTPSSPGAGPRPGSIEHLLAPLAGASNLRCDWLGSPAAPGNLPLPRFIFRGPNSSDPIRLGIFACIHGDEPAGAMALVQFLLDLATEPALAENYEIYAYPVCNPTGFEDHTRHSRAGLDLNREFWKSSSQPEVRLLEHELQTVRFNGLIQLHSDDTSHGIYGFVRGATLTEELLRPAMLAAAKILPRNEGSQIDGFAARDGVIYDLYEGVLVAPSSREQIPFEIIFETPQLAPLDRQVAALDVFLRTVLTEYRQLISFAQNI